MKALFFLPMLLLLAYPSYALTAINAQSTTSCDIFGNCQTVLDLSRAMTAKSMAEVLATNYTSSMLKNSNITMSYKFNGTNIIIYGKVYKDTYWSLDLRNGYAIDPWWNTTFARKQQWNISSTLPCTRYNASFQFNISRDYANLNCTDIAMADSTETTRFTQFTVTNNSDNCTIKAYDNFTSMENKTYYVYFNCSACNESALFKTPKAYEILWNYSSTSQFMNNYGTGGLSEKTVDGQVGITFKCTSGTECHWNVTDWCQAAGSEYEFYANCSKENTAQTNFGICNLWLNMNSSAMRQGYESFAYGGDISVRNWTANSNGDAYTNTVPDIQDNIWYVRIMNRSSAGNISSFYDAYMISHVYGNMFKIGTPGVGGYDGASWSSNLTYKDMQGRRYGMNLNFTINNKTQEEYVPPPTPLNPVVDNTVICFQTQPVCINLKDSSLIYKGGGVYG